MKLFEGCSKQRTTKATLPLHGLILQCTITAKYQLNIMTPEEIDVYSTSVRWTVSHSIIFVL